MIYQNEKSTDTDINILLTSVGRRAYLVEYFKKELQGRGKVYVVNSSSLTTCFQLADGAAVSPLIYSDDYIPFLIDFVRRHKIRAIIPLFDVDLPILAENKNQFENLGVQVIVSDKEVIKICNDKWKTFQFLNDHHINTPHTYLSLEKAKQDIDNEILSYPVIVKPRWGMGSIAVYEADNEEELDVFYHKAQRKIFETYLEYEAEENINECVIIQEKVSGQEYGLDIINDLKGNYQTTAVKKKCAMRSGETDCAVTVDCPEIQAMGEKIALTLQHIGNLDVDIFMEGEKIYILEMNARFGGGYPFSHLAGANLPAAIISWILGEEVEKSTLMPRVNVMGQKELTPVRLIQNSMRLEMVENNDVHEIYQAIKLLDHNLPLSLSDRNIDMEEYAKKIFKYGFAVILYDEQKTPWGIAAGYANDEKEKCSFLTLLVVDSQYRSMHYGEKLLEQFERISEKRGMWAVRLQTGIYNVNAIRFYKSQNYQIEKKDTESSYLMIKNPI